MPKINILDRETAELIAAGEVIARPAAVVKELVENSIDAGATAITVEIGHGGVRLIRVTDNGCGIEREDVPKAFLRHATSKVLRPEDLDRIGTLGFRGEALASICAVSETEILTRAATEEIGTRYTLAGECAGELAEAGCPVGTTITAKNLFYNVPARMKFLKKDSTEGTAVATLMDRLALSHPEIAFKLIRDREVKLATPGSGDLLAAIFAVYGNEFGRGLIPVECENGPIRISGYLARPECCRPSRSMEHFFINNRYVKSVTIMAAVEESYRNHIMVGKFPGCIINLMVDPAQVDVNVHPAKKTSMIIETADAAPFQSAQVYLAKFAFATDVTFTEKYEGSTDGMVQVSTHAARGFIPMMELIDREKELARLNKEKAKAEKEMAMFGNQLNNPKFVERAPAALVEEIRTKFAKSQDKLANIEQSIKALG